MNNKTYVLKFQPSKNLNMLDNTKNGPIGPFFYILLISFLNNLFNIIADITTPIASASGNASQTSVTPKILIKINASGRIPKNCLVNDTSKLYVPYPVAWYNVAVMIPNAANGKHKLISLKAGIPILNISCDASNIINNCVGNAWNNASPKNITVNATFSAVVYVFSSLSLSLAPKL